MKNKMDKRLHVLHVLLSLEPGGLETGVVNVVNRLNPDHFRSSIGCIKHAGEFAARITASEVKIYELGWRGGNDLILPFRLARLFRKVHPDIIHSRNAESFFYAYLGAKLAGVKCIVHSEHGRTFNDRKIRFLMQKWFSEYTHAIFSVSTQLKADLVKHIHIPKERIEVLHNGVDLNQFKSVQRQVVRDKLGFRDDQIIIGSVGRLVAVKNYALLLSAFHQLNLKNAVVMLVGEGGERKILEELAQSLAIADRVHFLGHRDDVAELLLAMDIFVLPSVSEGMSNTLLEAMAVGIAPVASDVGGNPEIVEHGVSGFVFPSRDESALREYLMMLATDTALRGEIGSAARDKVKKEFTIDAMVARYESLYHRVWLEQNTENRREQNHRPTR